MGTLISTGECWRPDLSKIPGLQVEVVHDRGGDARQFKSGVNGGVALPREAVVGTSSHDGRTARSEASVASSECFTFGYNNMVCT